MSTESNSERRRVLVVSNMYPSPADPVFGIFVQRHVRGLEAAGASVEVVANRDTRTGVLSNARKYLRLLLRARGIARRGGFDVVVGHFLYPTAMIARATARVARAPLVLVTHGTDVNSLFRGGRIARWCRAAMDDAALVVCVSGALEKRLRDGLGLCAEIPTAVVDMGIDTDCFAVRPDARARSGWPAGQRIALFAGNLVQVKGVDVLIEAFALLRQRDACDRLVVVGDGPLREQLEAQAAAAELGDAVDFLGRATADELAVYMGGADVFVLPSRAEGLGLVLAEALASGTPCVASRVGGVPEVLETPSCGRLVDPDDPEALATAIAEVVAEGKERFSGACAARGGSFDFRGRARRFLETIEEVVL